MCSSRASCRNYGVLGSTSERLAHAHASMEDGVRQYAGGPRAGRLPRLPFGGDHQREQGGDDARLLAMSGLWRGVEPGAPHLPAAAVMVTQSGRNSALAACSAFFRDVVSNTVCR